MIKKQPSDRRQLLENKLRKMIREEIDSSATFSASHIMTTSVLGIKNNSILFEKKIRDGSLTVDDVDIYIDFIENSLNSIKKESASKRK
jgi:hypothetical protein